jgi:hypothetical protein
VFKQFIARLTPYIYDRRRCSCLKVITPSARSLMIAANAVEKDCSTDVPSRLILGSLHECCNWLAGRQKEGNEWIDHVCSLRLP